MPLDEDLELFVICEDLGGLVEDRLELGQMPRVLFGVCFQFPGRLLGDFLGEKPQLLPGLQRANIGLRSPLEIIQPVEGFRKRPCLI